MTDTAHYHCPECDDEIVLPCPETGAKDTLFLRCECCGEEVTCDLDYVSGEED